MTDIEQTKKDMQDLKKQVNDHTMSLTNVTETLKRIEEKLDPISTAYQTTTTLGKWVMASLLFVSIIIGILVEWKNLISK